MQYTKYTCQFVLRRHKNIYLYTGNRVNAIYEELLPDLVNLFRTGDPKSQTHFTTHCNGQRANQPAMTHSSKSDWLLNGVNLRRG